MRKIITLQLWADDDYLPKEKQGGYEMCDDILLQDLQQEIGSCWHSFEITKFETAVIANAKCFTYNSDNIIQHGAF